VPTLDNLISRVRRQLLGDTLIQEVVLELAAELPEDATVIQLEESRDAGRGLLEIGEELILVRSVDQVTKTATVAGGAEGRGYEGTVASAHPAGSLVRVAPRAPKAFVREHIQDTIRSLYPSLVAFGTHEFTYHPARVEYPLPADAEDVWTVTAQTIGPSRAWMTLLNWRYNPTAAGFTEGKSIQILDGVVPGRTIRVVYARKPQVPLSGADDWSVTGLSDSASDLAVWGACARMVPSLETGRLQRRTVEATMRSEVVPAQSAARTAAYYQALFTERLREERIRMFELMPQGQTYQGT
jgi:hypothetical protein